LGKHIGHTADWAGDRDRKEGHVECKFDERRIEFFPAVEIEQVTHGLKGPEGDSQRQREMSKSLQRRERHGNGNRGKIFERAQQNQVKQDARRQERSGLFSPNCAPEKEIHHRRSQQDDKEPSSPCEIQRAACEQKNQLSNTRGTNARDDNEAKQESYAVEAAAKKHASLYAAQILRLDRKDKISAP